MIFGRKPKTKKTKKKQNPAACCLGTMTWGGKQNDAKDASEQLSYAFDNGVNWFDTAEIYAIPPSKETSGNTDRCIAPWLAQRDRTKVIVATKVAGFGNDYLRKGKEKGEKEGGLVSFFFFHARARSHSSSTLLLLSHFSPSFLPLLLKIINALFFISQEARSPASQRPK